MKGKKKVGFLYGSSLGLFKLYFSKVTLYFNTISFDKGNGMIFLGK